MCALVVQSREECPSVRGNNILQSITLFTVASKELFNPPGQRKCCTRMRRVYNLRVHTYTRRRRTHTEITPAKCFVVRMRDNECSILWVWHRKVGRLTAMIPVGVIFITIRQQTTSEGVPVYSILLQVNCCSSSVYCTFFCECIAAVELQTNKDLLTLG